MAIWLVACQFVVSEIKYIISAIIWLYTTVSGQTVNHDNNFRDSIVWNGMSEISGILRGF